MHGRDLFAAGYQPRDFIVAARDRADETVDHIRAVRTADFKYIKNYFPNRPYLQPNAYKDGKPIVQAMRRLHAEGKLTPEQSLIMADTRPKEELYDLRTDPDELHNLAANPAYAGLLAGLRQQLHRWEEETNDQGRHPEPPDVYAQEMNSSRNEAGGETVGGKPETRRNVELMQRWATERPQIE
jgi:arylsulfatase A-like enzyme